MIKASIVGVTGYAGIELLRLLNFHPQVELQQLVSHSQAGKNLAEVYPQFAGVMDYQLKEYEAGVLAESDVVFTALPHGVSQDVVSELMTEGVKVIDLSGDFRYEDTARYNEWYETEHKYPDLMSRSVYGLVELNREQIVRADLVANPGCYPTASLLGLLPLMNKKNIDSSSIIIDAKSGVSGAGRSLKQVSQFNEADESIKAYKIAEHRHTSEIESVLETFTGAAELPVSFTPHLVPMKRGILATIYINLKKQCSEEDLIDLYHEFYEDDKFVQMLSPQAVPDTKYVAGTNYCHLGVKVDDRLQRVIIMSVIDNLGKGAAGQALQNMNVMFGLKEEIGLQATGVFP